MGTMTTGDRSIRILLADEQGLFLEAVRATLDREPDLQVVAEAEDGYQAIAKADESDPDVAILSANLPNCDGIRAASVIVQRVPGCSVLILSGAEETGARRVVDAVEAGASGYLTKDIPLADLIEATRALRRGEILIPDQMLVAFLGSFVRRWREVQEALRTVARLTRREKEVLALLAEGGNNEGIARALVISPDTARTHIQNILNKLHLHSRLEAAAFVRRTGILQELGSVYRVS